jgi:cyclic pyranopterin phosphate synthase
VTPIADVHGRFLRNLRVSVTDRCNLRCGYCMPEEEYVWLPRDDILHFGEMAALADVFLDLGVDKVRLTGGEPLLRRDLPRFIRMLATKPRIRDLAMTTNGVLLAEHAPALKAAGLHRVTVSLDTLDPQRFARLTNRPTHAQVLEGIASVPRAGFTGTKLDTVVIRGVNDDELAELIEFGKRVPAAPPGGRPSRSSVARRCSMASSAATAGSSRSSRARRRRPIASGCPTAPPSASSRPRRRRSVPTATAAG